MKLIGLDVGTKRIGVAKADTSTRIALPDGFIVVNGQEFSEIARLSRLYNTNIFVIGLPRSNNGNETQQTAYVRNFAKQLSSIIPNARVYFQDESLTSVEAENRLKARKKSYQKGEIDAEAAAIILQDCIERMTANGGKITQTAPKTAPEAPGAPAKAQAVSDASKPKKAPKEAQNAPESVSTTGKKLKLKSSHKRGKTIGLVALVIILIIGLAFGGLCIWYNASIAPVAADAGCKYSTSEEQAIASDNISDVCKFVRFTVSESEGVAQIGNNLEAAGLIKSSLAFQIHVRLKGDTGNLQAGDYDFRQTMSTSDIAYSIANGLVVSNVFNFTILPGETLADVKAKLLEIGYSENDIQSAFVKHYDSPVLEGLYDIDGNLINSAQPLDHQLEGYLYGETYQFYNGESVENIAKRAINELNEVVVGNNLKEKFSEHGLSLREGIILASIVQKEAKSDDMAGVAQVFLNRIRVGMSLGSDVTATYAADLVDPDRKTLTDNAAILNHDSLYNTRFHTGLTPGPISMPSITALLAVASPDTSRISDYYFLTGDDGKMYYSSTAEGHSQNIRDYCQTLCSVAL